MMKMIEAVAEYVHEYWIRFLMAALFMSIGWFLGKWRARGQWKRKEFLGRLNVSLNLFEEGQLLIRTLIEKSCDEIFLNSVAVKMINSAAKKTTGTSPILSLPEGDYWYYLNAILNEISEKFASGQIRRDMGLPVQKARYLICLTRETDGDVRTQKVRAMVIKKQTLLKLPEDEPKFESPTHATRWRTLKQLAAEFETQPIKFLEVEICA